MMKKRMKSASASQVHGNKAVLTKPSRLRKRSAGKANFKKGS